VIESTLIAKDRESRYSVEETSTSNRMNAQLPILVFVGVLLAPVLPLLAQEHPRAPQQSQSQQLPQTTTGNPPSATQTMVVSDAEISAGVKKYIYTHGKKSTDKKFHVRSGGKDVALDLITIHDDRRSHLGGDKYFACVDMKAADGAVYDIDFFIVLRPGRLSVTESSVHKVNGKPLYNWKEEGGVWKRVPVSQR
jgi:hypothetical protein